ncbi:hypothetical protein [Cochleicola gelatinilyticus]|nr:hypothetical protein [Cochleicola gelatinilyticus]
MKKSFGVYILLILLMCACNEKASEKRVNTLETTSEATPLKNSETPTGKVNATQIQKQLQGVWKEAEYPFRKVEFKDWMVKLTEEGVSGSSTFETYALAGSCRFANTNIKDVTPTTLLLTLTESERCEKMNLTDTTLTLSGFNTSSNANYEIVYLKQ